MLLSIESIRERISRPIATIDACISVMRCVSRCMSSGSSVGAPATCKNCLTVGASENNEPDANRQDGNVAVFSSQGPSLGRNKPDVAEYLRSLPVREGGAHAAGRGAAGQQRHASRRSAIFR